MKIYTTALPCFVLTILLGTAIGETVQEKTPEREEIRGIYAAEASHLWNRLHQSFFVRPGAAHGAMEADSVDPPLWRDTSGFLLSGPSHQAALGVLDEFLSKDGAGMVSDPVKRAVLQHDLWNVFDWCASIPAADDIPEGNVAALQSHLSAVIGRLALTPSAIAALPDNLAAAAASQTFPTSYDPENPMTPFLPADLLDPKGPWVCVRGAFPGAVAPVHVEYYRGNSPFLVFMRLPGGRQATMQYLSELNSATAKSAKNGTMELPLFPVGTAVALLRQLAVIDTTGQIQMTPLTQTLQMRVYRQVGPEVTDHENSQAVFKFSLKRRDLFANRGGGLTPVDWSEPLQISLLQRNDIYSPKASMSGIKTVMQSCIACHSCGGATIQSVFTYQQNDWVPGAYDLAANSLCLSPTISAVENQVTLAEKTKRSEWGLLTGLLDVSLIPPSQ